VYTCDDIQKIVVNDDFEKLTKILERPSEEIKQCQKLPNAMIGLFRGYSEREIPRDKVFSIFSILRKKNIMTPEFNDRVMSLEDFSYLNLPDDILYELRKQY
jgi:hypothetical protein